MQISLEVKFDKLNMAELAVDYTAVNSSVNLVTILTFI